MENIDRVKLGKRIGFPIIIGIVLYGAISFGINFKESQSRKFEIEELTKEKLQLEIELLQENKPTPTGG